MFCFVCFFSFETRSCEKQVAISSWKQTEKSYRVALMASMQWKSGQNYGGIGGLKKKMQKRTRWTNPLASYQVITNRFKCRTNGIAHNYFFCLSSHQTRSISTGFAPSPTLHGLLINFIAAADLARNKTKIHDSTVNITNTHKCLQTEKSIED